MDNNENIKCNHDINSPETTIILLDKVHMTYPARYYGVCPICKKQFMYVKEDEKYVEVEKTGGEE